MKTKRLKGITALFLIFSACICAADQNELWSQDNFVSDAWYFDKYFNRTERFKVEGTEIIVKLDEYDVAKSTLLASVYDIEELHALDEEYYFVHYRIPLKKDIWAVLKRINAEKDVASAFPVLIDMRGAKKPVVGNEMTVRFISGLTESACEAIIEEMGSRVVQDHWTPGYYTITVPAGMTLFEGIRAYNARSDVKFAEFFLIGYDDALFIPNDPDFDDQQNLLNTGQVPSCDDCPPFGDHDIDAVTAWDITRGDPDIIVTIIDSGCDLDHPDLVDNYLDRDGEDWNFASTSSDVPEDTYGHGTSCAGIAAAVSDNAEGVAGIANHCRIMPLKIDLSSGANQNRADAINYAASRIGDFDGIVMSNSWRMSSGSYTAVYAAIESAKAAGCVVCFAAGNENQSPVEAPSDSEHCICVGALSPCDERKSYSSCDGESWGSSYGNALDVAAPGVLIHTTEIGGGYTGTFNGTSSACPHVAGVCALILSIAPNLTPDELQEALQDGCDDIDPPGWDTETGYGRVNAYNSLNLVSGVFMNKKAYQCEDTVYVSVRDSEQSVSIEVEVTSNTETLGETLTLLEIPGDAGLFEGSIVCSEIPPSSGDDIISVVHGDEITVYYPALDKSASSAVDCSAPDISEATLDNIGDIFVEISWATDEPATTKIVYGIGTPDQFYEDYELTDAHEVRIDGLTDCENYVFYVESSDAAGNTAIDDNGGTYYSFTTQDRVILLEADMDTDPGWSTDGLWEWGQPAGQGGDHGGPDPSSGHTGNNVYGYNLNGDYTNYMGETDLTTPAFDCSNADNVKLSFYRWLGVERSYYDHAYLRISTNGSSWTTVWQNPDAETYDGQWVLYEYDISQFADGEPAVYLKWVMGTTDSAWVYCGWNIDDVVVSYTIPCQTSPTPTAPPTFTPTLTPTATPTRTPTYSPTPTLSPTLSPTATLTPTTTTTVTLSPTCSPSLTPTDPPSYTPTVIITATPSITPTLIEFTPSVTPTHPLEVGVELIISDEMFHPGMLFELKAFIENPGPETYEEQPFVILLDVLGMYFYYPFWDTTFSFEPLNLGVETIEKNILTFTWPETGEAALDGIVFYGALLTSDFNDILGRFDAEEFGYGPE